MNYAVITLLKGAITTIEGIKLITTNDTDLRMMVEAQCKLETVLAYHERP